MLIAVILSLILWGFAVEYGFALGLDHHRSKHYTRGLLYPLVGITAVAIATLWMWSVLHTWHTVLATLCLASVSFVYIRTEPRSPSPHAKTRSSATPIRLAAFVAALLILKVAW